MKPAIAALLCLALQAYAAPPGAGVPAGDLRSPPPGKAGAALQGRETPPEPGPPPPIVVPPVAHDALPNGLAVVVAQRHDMPLVTAMLLVPVGPEADPPGRAGLAEMTATLLARGARRDGRTVGAIELAREAEALGSALNTDSSWRATTVSMTVTRPKLEPALRLIADVARHPTLQAEELDRARARAIDGLRVALSDPGEVARMTLRRAFWGPSAFGAVTTVQSLQSLRHDDVLGFHRAWFRPDAATLVLAGDLEPEEGLELARSHFGDWRGGPPPAKVDAAPAQPIDAPLVAVDMPGSGQSGVAVAAPYVSLDAPDRRAAQVAASVLGGGHSARLNEEVRIKRGLSYGVSAHTESHAVGGMLAALAQTQPATAQEVLALVRGEIERLAGAAPPPDEVQARQAALVGAYARRLETTGGLAGQIAALIAQRRPLEELGRFADEIRAVRPEQVRELAARLWRDGPLRAVVAGDARAMGETVQAPGVLVVPITDLDLDRAGLRRPR